MSSARSGYIHGKAPGSPWGRGRVANSCLLVTLCMALVSPCLGRVTGARRYAGARVDEVIGTLGSRDLVRKTTWYSPDAARFIVPAEGWGFGAIVKSHHPLRISFLDIDTQKKEITEVPASAEANFASGLYHQYPGLREELNKALEHQSRIDASQHPGPWKVIGSIEYLGLRCRVQRRIYPGAHGNHWEIRWVAQPLRPGTVTGNGSLALFHEERKADGTVSIDQITSVQLYRTVPTTWFAVPKGYKVIHIPADSAGKPGGAVPPGRAGRP